MDYNYTNYHYEYLMTSHMTSQLTTQISASFLGFKLFCMCFNVKIFHWCSFNMGFVCNIVFNLLLVADFWTFFLLICNASLSGK